MSEEKGGDKKGSLWGSVSIIILPGLAPHQQHLLVFQ